MNYKMKQVPIKQLKVGDTFDRLKTSNLSYFASFEILELNNAYVKLKIYDREEKTYSTEDCYVEIPLTEKEFQQKYHKEAKELIEKLKNEMSKHDDIGYHEMANGWIRVDIYEFAAECKDRKYEVIGYFSLSTPKDIGLGTVYDIGIVAEDEFGERFWCHYSKKWIDSIIKEWERS